LEQLRVPTMAREARIHYFDERALTGRLFLPAFAERHEGPMRVEEWINKPGLFFPFLVDGEERARILNKRYVIVLSLRDENNLEIEFVGSARKVQIECGTLRIAGTAYIDMPEHQQRILDWVNKSDPFLLLRNEEGIHIVQKNRITLIAETPED
jgi:hypothetical protein